LAPRVAACYGPPMRRSWLVVPMAALLTAGLLMPACATDANDVTGCRQLEDARCVRAQSCGIDLQTPLHAGSSADDAVEACQLFYQDACLHGLLTTVPPVPKLFQNCLDKIQSPTSSCNYVINPQSEPECSWLIPPDAGVDAGTDVGTPDVIVIVVDEYPDATISDGAADALAACYDACNSMCTGDGDCVTACEAECQSQ